MVDWNSIVAIGTIASALGSLAVAGLARGQLTTLRTQVSDAARGVEAAQTSADAAQVAATAAQAAALDSSKARADDDAPRVIALMEEPKWSPLLDSQRSAMPNATQERLLSDESRRVRACQVSEQHAAVSGALAPIDQLL